MKKESKSEFDKWRDIIIVVGVIYSAIYLYTGALPNVVYSEINCPYFYSGYGGLYAHNVPVQLTNYGGSNTFYLLNISANGFKLTKEPLGSWSSSIIEELNSKYNATELTYNYFLGVGKDAISPLTIFTSTSLPEKASFEIKYKFKTFFLIPWLGKWSEEMQIVKCEYELSKDPFDKRYVLIEKQQRT